MQTECIDLNACPGPSSRLAGIVPYRPQATAGPIDLRLDGNEGLLPDAALLEAARITDPELLRRYPSAHELESILAARHGVDPERVMVAAGADEALDRCFRALLDLDREIILPEPTFEMLPRYARLAGARIVSIPWFDAAYPIDEVRSAISRKTAIIMVVSPNNPTGAVATSADLIKLSAAAPHATVVVDLAYGDFADEDLTPCALRLPNTIVVRSMSKSWGMAGLRVGYAVGSLGSTTWLRAAGSPYPVSGLSLVVAREWLTRGAPRVAEFLGRVRMERTTLSSLLSSLGARTNNSQANFVFARSRHAAWVRDALAGLGIAVRAFPDRAGLEDALRITCPGDQESFDRLTHGLRTALAPEAILFDLDGVIADVTDSYRRTIIETAATFGVALSPAEIASAKAAGNANNDWLLTQRLLMERGVESGYMQVRKRFEAIYQGTVARPGLRRFESTIADVSLLRRLRQRLPLAIVTGRPRVDAERFLAETRIRHLFDALICMEDGAAKPSPEPVNLALQQVGVRHAWMIGDTVDDVCSARQAGVIPLGIAAPGDSQPSTADVLIRAGAARVLRNLNELEDLLP